MVWPRSNEAQAASRLASSGRWFLAGSRNPSSTRAVRIPTPAQGEMTSTVTVALLVPSGKVSSRNSVISCAPSASELVKTALVERGSAPSDQKYLKLSPSGSEDLEPSNTTEALVLSGAMTRRLVQPANVASGEISITGTGGLLPGNTMTLKLHWLALPAASLAEQMTRFVPSAKAEPEGGLQTGALGPSQLSRAAKSQVAVEVQASCAFVSTRSGGQVIVGACASRTTTRKLQSPTLPAASVAVHRTVVVPTGKQEPGGGVQVRFVPAEQKAITGGRRKRTTAPHSSKSLVRMRLLGHPNTGGVVSSTVTTALQELDRPIGSVTVRVTRLLPSG